MTLELKNKVIDFILENTALSLHILLKQVEKVNKVDYIELFTKLEENRNKEK